MTVEKTEDNKGNEEVLAQLKQLTDKVASLEAENTTLKNFAATVGEERRQAKEKFDAEKARLEQEKLDAKTHTKEESANLIKQYKEENDKLKADIEAGKQKEYQNRVREEASKLADTLTKDSIRKELLTEKFEKQIKLDENGKVVVLDDNKQPTISPVDVLVKSISDRYKCLIDGLDSSGGGAHSSGGAQVKKLSQMSEGEKVELFRNDNAKYRELEKLE